MRCIRVFLVRNVTVHSKIFTLDTGTVLRNQTNRKRSSRDLLIKNFYRSNATHLCLEGLYDTLQRFQER